jgi:hypothetical protein
MVRRQSKTRRRWSCGYTGRLHGAGHALRSGWRRKQMKLIGHQHMGVVGKTAFADGLAEPCQLLRVVLGRKENRLPVVAARIT